MRDDVIIDLKGVSKKYSETYAVKDFNFYIRKGEFVTFLGPSGCGKTTTLRMIAGFELPTEGEILIDGKNIVDVPPHLRPVNTVFQKYALFPHLNVFENIAFGLKMKRNETPILNADGTPVLNKDGSVKVKKEKIARSVIERKVRSALKIVGLTGYEKRDVNSLSGGQQQRVAIARAIANEPKILLLDEPLGALDLKMRQEMQLELKEMHQKLGITFIYVTHDQEEALTMSDTVVVMRDGEIQQIGTPEMIYNEPKNAFVANFIGESNILNGIMLEDFLVRIEGQDLECLDKGFQQNEDVDVVIRPEDIYITDRNEKGKFHGTVISSVFKGVHYEMMVKTESGCEFEVRDTREFKPGSEVSLFIDPDDLHIMHKQRVTNTLYGEVVDFCKIDVAGGTFACNTNKLLDHPTLNEEKRPVDADGNEISLVGTKVVATVPFDKIILTDDEEDGIVGGDVISILFKGTHYHVQVRTDDGVDFFVDTQDQWDDGDRVGIDVNPRDIKLVRAEVE